MGMFSWFSQNKEEQIIVDEKRDVFMVDDKGNSWKEECYEGYGIFDEKDFYELLAEMNGLESSRDAGIELAFSDQEYKSPNLFHDEIEEWRNEEPSSDPDQGCEFFEEEDFCEGCFEDCENCEYA